MFFSPFYKQISISMSVSALFSVPQQHYLSFTLSSCRAQLLLFILFLGRKEFYVHSVNSRRALTP